MRRRIAFVGGALSAAVVTMFACGFPGLEFAPDQQFVDGTFVPDAVVLDEAGRLPDGGNPDGNPCIGDPICDCDDDKDLKISCDGGDCNDFDPRVNSRVTAFNGDVPLDDAGDWNCDGKVETENDASLNFQCTDVLDGSPLLSPSLVADACAQAQGFTEDLGCGRETNYIKCYRRQFDDKECVVANGYPVRSVRKCR